MTTTHVTETPRSPGDDTGMRDRILASAQLCFAHQVYDEVEMTDVAWGASVPVGTVRDHFRSKDALFAAVLADWLTRGLGDGSDHGALGLVLRALADPACAAVTADNIGKSRLGSLGAHHLLAAARLLGGTAASIREQGIS